MSEESPPKLKVVRAGAQDPDVIGLRTLAVIVCVVVATVLALRNGPHHLWRSIGPGSSSYRACWALVQEEYPLARFRAVQAREHGESWSFRFELDFVTADNSPAGEGVQRCNGRDGDVSLEGF